MRAMSDAVTQAIKRVRIVANFTLWFKTAMCTKMQLNYYHIKIYKFVNVFSYSEIKIQTTERDGEQIRRQEVI